MVSRYPRYGKEEFARRGDDFYDRDILPRVEAEDEGKFVAIDVETGAWEMDADALAACDRLKAQVPDAQTWLVRVGQPYAHRIGGPRRRA